MKYVHRKTEIDGYYEIVDEESSLELLRFGLLKFNQGQSITLHSDGYEIGLVVLSGNCTVECEGCSFKNIGGRKDVFSGKPATVYIPMNSAYSISSTGGWQLEIGICKAKADKKYKPFYIAPEQAEPFSRGKLNWHRNAYDIIDERHNGMVDKIVLGETFNLPGNWSSYPPHKHDRDALPVEVNMEEIYHYRVSPPQGFGIQVMYNERLTLNESHIIRDGDTIEIKEGYHPVAAAPGYQVYYLWMMAGRSGRKLTPFDDPKHMWIKAVDILL